MIAISFVILTDVGFYRIQQVNIVLKRFQNNCKVKLLYSFALAGVILFLAVFTRLVEIEFHRRSLCHRHRRRRHFISATRFAQRRFGAPNDVTRVSSSYFVLTITYMFFLIQLKYFILILN